MAKVIKLFFSLLVLVLIFNKQLAIELNLYFLKHNTNFLILRKNTLSFKDNPISCLDTLKMTKYL